MVAEAWRQLTELNLKRARNKLLGDEQENENSGEYSQQRLQNIVTLIREPLGFSECHFSDAEYRLKIDRNDPRFRILDDNEIRFAVRKKQG